MYPRVPELAIAILLLFSYTCMSQGTTDSRRNAQLGKGFLMQARGGNTLAGDTIVYPGSKKLCQGSSLLLTAPGGNVFVWKLDGAIIPAATAATYNATASGTYTVVVDGIETEGLVITSVSTPVPNFTFSPNVCSGTPIQFVSSVSAGTAPYNYSWDFGDGNTSTQVNPVHIYTSLGCGVGTFEATLTITDANGCAGVIKKTVSIIQAPDVSIQDTELLGTPFSNCDNSPNPSNPNYKLTISNSSRDSSCITSYVVDWGDGTTQTNATFPLTHLYTQLGAFNLVVTAVGSNGCSGSKTYEVANQSNPDIGIATFGPTIGCAPLPVSIVVTTWAANSPGTTYLLSYGDGSSRTMSHPINPALSNDTVVHTYNTTPCPLPAYQLKVTATNACKSKSFAGGDIEVRTKPAANFNVPANSCVGQRICMTNTSILGFGSNCTTATVYSWDFGDNTKSSLANPCHTYTNPGVYTITLTTTNSCGSSTVTKQICVTMQVTSSFTIDRNAGCAPLTVTTTNTSIDPAACSPATYNWQVTYKPDNCGIVSDWTFGSASQTNPSFTFKGPGLYTITLTVTNPCGVNTSSRTINVKRPPTVMLAALQPVCGQTTITPSATIASCGTSVPTYLWTFAGGTPASSTSANPGPVSFANPGNHLITLNVTNECGTTSAVQTFNVQPVANFTTPASASYCPGQTVPAATFGGTVSGATYSWTNSDVSIGLPAAGSGSTIPSFTATNNTPIVANATITLSGTLNGCTTTSTYTLTVNPRPATLTSLNLNYCLNEPAAPIVITGAVGNVVTWYTTPALTAGSSATPVINTAVPSSSTYYVTQTNATSCQSNAAIVQVVVSPVLGNNVIQQSQTLCSGTAPTLLSGTLPTGGDGTYNYQWQVSTDNGGTWTSVAGAAAATFQPDPLTAITLFRRIILSGACIDTSNAVTMNIQGSLTNFDVGVSQTICEAQTPALLKGETPAGGDGTFGYQWERSATGTAPWITITGATNIDFQPPQLSNTTYYRRRVVSGTCTAFSNVAAIKVNPKPVAALNATSSSICGYDAGEVQYTAGAGTAPFNVRLLVTATGYSDTIRSTLNNNTGLITVLPAGTAPGNYTIVLDSIADANGCLSTGALATANITVKPVPVIAVTPSLSLCFGSSAPLNVTGATTYSWTPSAGLSNATAASVIATPSNTITYTVTGTTNGCSSTLPVTVTVNPTPVKPQVTSPLIYCQNEPALPLIAIPAGGNTLTWFDNPQLANPSPVPPVPSTINAGTTTYFVYQANAFNCISDTNTLEVIVRPAINNNTISADQSVCFGGLPSTLTGAVPSGSVGVYSYQWQILSGGGTTWSNIPGASTLTYTPGPQTSTTKFRRVVISGPCSSTSNEVTITVHPLLTRFGIRSAQTVCTGTAPVQLTGEQPLGGDGIYGFQWQLSGDNNTWIDVAGAVGIDYQPPVLTADTYYRRQVTSGSCSATSSPILITIAALPVMNPVADVVQCSASANPAIGFNSNMVNAITYTWTNTTPAVGLPASGTGNALPAFTTNNTTNPQQPQIATITVTPLYTVDGLGCAGSPANFNITVLPTVAVQPIADVEVCTGTTVAGFTPATTAAPFVGSATTFSWTVTGAGTSLQNGSGPSLPTYTTVNTGNTNLVTNITVVPFYSFGGLTCAGQPFTYKVTVKEGAQQAFAGSDTLLCGASTFTLQGNIATGASMRWSQIAGSLVSISNPNTINATANGLTPGQTYQFLYTITGFAACPPSLDTITVINRPPLTQPNAGADQAICNFSQANNQVTINGNSNPARPFEAGNWSFAGQPNGAIITQVDSPTTTVTFVTAGIYPLVYTIKNDAGCAPLTDTVVIRVFASPIAATIKANTTAICAGQSVTLTAEDYTGTILKWQYQRNGTSFWIDTAVTTPTITFYGLTDTFNVRVIVASNGVAFGCTSALISNVVLVQVAPPSKGGNTNNDALVCKNSNSGTIDLSRSTGKIIAWQYSINSGLNWQDLGENGTTYTYSNLDTTTWYRVVVQSGNCDPVFSDTTVITVVPPVSTAMAGADQKLCNTTTFSLNGNLPANGETGFWTRISGPSVRFSSTTINNPVVAGVVPGTYVFRWTLTNRVCINNTDDVQVIVYPAVVSSIDNTPRTVCSGQPVTIVGAPATGGEGSYLFQWQQSLDNGNTWIDIAGQANPSITVILPQTMLLRRVVFSGPCTDFSNTVLITVQPPLQNNTISSNQAICINQAAAVLTGLQPTGGDGLFTYQWQKMEAGQTAWVDIAGATLPGYNPGILQLTTSYRRVVSTVLCSGSEANQSNEVVITVHPNASAVFVFAADTSCAPFRLDSNFLALQRFDDRVGNYQWYINNNFAGSGAFPGYTISNGLDSVSIKLVATSKFGCKNDSLLHTFYTINKSMPAFTVSDSLGCGPLTVSFTNTTPDIGFYTYMWDFGNGITSLQPQPQNVSFLSNPNNSDTIYKVALTVYSQCDTTTIIKDVKIQSKPKALFTPDKTIGCSPLLVKYNNTSRGVNTSYVWDFGDGTVINTSSAAPVQHTYNTGVQDTFYTRLIATNPCGSDTQVYAIVVAPNKIQLDFAVNGNQVNGCSPHTVLFINNSKNATSFKWDFGDGNVLSTTRNIDSIVHVYVQTGRYNVRLQASNGCSDTTTFEQIEVYAKPIIDFAYLPSPICAGDSIRFTNQSDTITGLNWRFGDGKTSTLINPVYKYALPGVYTVTLVGLRQYGTGATCTDSSRKTVTVLASQPGSFSVSDSISSCLPFSVTFTNNSRPSALTTWDFGDGGKDTGNVVSYTFTRPGNFQVQMNATAAGGCLFTQTKTIAVGGPSGSFTYDNGVICGSVPVRLQVNAQNTDSVRFNFGDGTTLTTTNTTVYHTYLQAGNYVPSVLLLTGAGGTCRVNIPGTDTIKIDMVKAGFRDASLIQCGSTQVAFTDTSRAYSGIAGWRWTFGDGQISVLQNPVNAFTAANRYQVQLITTSKNGCSDTTLQTLPVPVNNLPVSAIVSDTTGCAAQSFRYTASVLSSDSIASYAWSFSNGANASSFAYTNVYNAAGTYSARLVVTTVKGCRDTARNSVIIHPSPAIRATADKVICRGQGVQLSVTGAPSYSWGPLYGLDCYNCANPVANPFVTTLYEVTATNTYECTARDTVNIVVVQPFKLTVSPNDTLCIGQSTQLIAAGTSVYRWSPATGLNASNISTPIAAPLLTTRYSVVGYDAEGCFTDTAYVTVAVGRYPVIDLGPDKTLSTGTRLPLTSTVTNGPITNWLWSPGATLSCTTCPQPVATIQNEVTYIVRGTTAYGCSATDSLQVKVFCESTQVFVPNLFTPDNDGVNDILMVRGTGIRSIKSFRIFNRWGEVVFERANISPNDASNGWNGFVKGVPAPADVYVYTCEVICDNGTPYVYKGNTAIIR